MDVSILGPLTVTHDGAEIPITAPMQRALLVLLAIHSDTSLSTDRIIDALWDDDPPSDGLRTLRFHVSKLRSALGPAASSLVTTPDGYLLDASEMEIDAAQFEELVRTGTELVEKQPDRAVAVLQTALDLWRGDALADVAYRVFAVPEAARLTELRTTARESIIEAKLNTATREPIVAEIQAMLDAHPHRERLWRLLMLALYHQQSQADALHAYQEAKNALADLGLEPSAELQHLEEQILLNDPALAPVDTGRLGNLPVRASSFIGRDDDLGRVVDLLDQQRVVTITGPGGVGKTSLAIEAARNVAARFTDGAWLVELAGQPDPELLESELATALQMTERGRRSIRELVIDRLRDQRILIVLDNCEHLIDAAASFVAHLIRSCPTLGVLATSREPLRIPGEAALPLDPLAIEPSGRERRSPAADLFVDRAAAIDARLRGDLAADPAVESICQRLDGIPLAIEMAAARVRSMSPESILDRIDRVETLRSGSRLAPPRHESMTAAIEWSYQLLTDAERMAFRRLAVFRGSFTLDAAEAVAADDQLASREVAALLDALIDASLVTPIAAKSRFRVLEPIRQFADGLGVDEAAAERHAQYYCRLAEEASAGLFDVVITTRFPKTLDRLLLERPNLRRALEWARASADHRLWARMARGLGSVLPSREWFHWFGPLLATAADHEPSVELAGALNLGIHHAADCGNLEDARRFLPLAFKVARAVSNPAELAFTYGGQGDVAVRDFDHEAAVASYEQQARLAKDVRNDLRLFSLGRLSRVLLSVGNYEEAERVNATVRSEATAANNEFRLAIAGCQTGYIAFCRGDLAEARRKLDRAWRTLHRFDHVTHFWAGTYLPRVLAADGDVGAAERVVDELGALLTELDRDYPFCRGWVELCRARVAIAAGSIGDATRAIREALLVLGGAPHLPTLLMVIDDLAQALAATDEPVVASTLLGGVDALRSTLRIVRPRPELACVEETLARIRHSLDEETFEAAWRTGQSLDANQLYAAALTATAGEDAAAVDEVPALVWTG